jgi:hypothetical protein
MRLPPLPVSEHEGSDPELAPFSVEFTPTYHYVRPWETPPTHAGVRAVGRMLSAVHYQVQYPPSMMRSCPVM